MTNGMFLVEAPISDNNPSGVHSKILAQVAAMKAAGLDCRLYSLQADGHLGIRRGLSEGVRRRLPFDNSNPPFIYTSDFNYQDFLYLRKPAYLTSALRRFLRTFKANNPLSRVVMELPTYPYDLEYGISMKEKPFLWKDRYNRTRLRGLVDCLAVVGDSVPNTLFDIPVLPIVNGILTSRVPQRTPQDDSVLDLCAVAAFAPWHGYDRLLMGIKEYYQEGGKRDICLHLVGDGPVLAQLRNLAEDPLLRGRVRFYGHLHGHELSRLYNQADFGVCSLGMSRKGFSYTSELKSREYLTCGLPLITACRIDVLEGQAFPWRVDFANDESPCSMAPILALFDRLLPTLKDRQDASQQIREFALDYVDISVTFRPVIDYLLAVSAKEGHL